MYAPPPMLPPTRDQIRPPTRTNAAALSGSDSTARTGAVRSDARFSQRIAQRVHVHLGNVRVGLDDQRRLHHQFRIRIADHGRGWDELFVSQLGNLPLLGGVGDRSPPPPPPCIWSFFTVGLYGERSGAIRLICSWTTF